MFNSSVMNVAKYVGGVVADILISANASNVNLYNLVASQYPDMIDMSELTVNATIKSGVIVRSTATSTPGFTTGTGWPADTMVNLTLESGSYITGMGGSGGSQNGGNGGVGLVVTTPTQITNQGTIQGGGGAGGGGRGFNNSVSNIVVVGGSGGAGYGSAGPQLSGNYLRGKEGSLTVGGTATAGPACKGGAGGSPGVNGETGIGHNGYYQAGAGGPATQGSNYITWVNKGTVLGSIT